MDNKYIMSLDQGTTSSRCIIYDHQGKPVGSGQQEFHQIYPEEGWVEHDPMEIWETQLATARKALEDAGLTASHIAGIGITNQRETTIVWDRNTGVPIYNAIVWQCRRTAGFCDRLKERVSEADWKAKTGLSIDPYFSASKLVWILDNVEGARERAESGDLLFGTIDTWLIWKLTGGKVHVTDYSNASRTMMFNIRDLCWDKDILRVLDIPVCMLPEPVESSKVYGETLPEIFGAAIPISGAAGDQQAALFGQVCFTPGEAKNTFGTGGFLLVNTGNEPVFSEQGLLTTIGWGLDGKVTYALEGPVFISGAAIQWLRDEMGLIRSASESEEICLSVEDTAGAYLVPAFTGLGAPWWDPYARGTIVGLTRGVNRNHIVRAAVEAMAYQSCDLADAMAREMGEPIRRFKVDGGASRDNFLLQFLADIMGQEVHRPVCIETTSLGAAYLAGLATGYWKDQQDILSGWQLDRTFEPTMTDDRRRALMSGWHRAVERSLGWARDQAKNFR